MLQIDAQTRTYRLAPAVLSLAHAMRTGSHILTVAAPLMRSLAESQRINVGLAAPDRDQMVYLESIRYSRRVALRHVVAGQRVPMELTSLGRAYLAVAPESRRNALLAVFRRRRTQWDAVRKAIEEAQASVKARGYCSAAWQPEVVASWLAVSNYQLKFVVGRESDVDEMEAMLQETACAIPPSKVLLMPEGTTVEALRSRAGWLSEICKTRGYRYAPRLHIELYGNKRGT